MQQRLRLVARAASITGTAIAVLAGCSGSGDSGLADDLSGTPPTGSGNRAPTISGNPPAAVMVGTEYSFTPQASDPDGDPLTFSIRNKPDWARFDSNTGTLSGVAGAGTEGLYGDIEIEVSDGAASIALPAFSVEVTQVVIGSATLTWDAPLKNVDGSALTDLAAYKLYYGRNPGDYSSEILIDNPGVTTYVVENLVADTYFFAITAINEAGEESRFSNEARHSVN
jgi:hypothetical protein